MSDTKTSGDLAGVADAINPGVSRRKVMVGLGAGAAFSLPVVASAISAPASAAVSPPICGGCASAGRCIITIGGLTSGDCQCQSNQFCVGTGPLNIANVCVGTDFILSQCGGQPCYGVCLEGISGAFTLAYDALALLFSLFTGVITPMPLNGCFSPLQDGTLGSICAVNWGVGPLDITLPNPLPGACQPGYKCTGIDLDKLPEFLGVPTPIGGTAGPGGVWHGQFGFCDCA